ncbi:MAG: orotidine-5'-phosphate decarboxylase [Flavobacteriales bacterium]|nr:orotidine-5'-phosphate decarboxylase [Flavobacteriales bacterium]
MTARELTEHIRTRRSFLCVGLDTDIHKLPQGVSPLAFNKAIIDATRDLCVAYKPNIAFYENMGPEGWELLAQTVDYIGKEHFTIADAKRGDIGNTSAQYAETFFKRYGFDSVTVAPYMGHDSVSPFLSYADKWTILLALTSNPGASDFETLRISVEGKAPEPTLWEEVIATSAGWEGAERLMYVIGATRAESLAHVRKLIPDHFLLVPGVGAQGGSLSDVARYGMNRNCGLLVNASRSILYAGKGADFADAARREAATIQSEMSELLGQIW